MGESFLLAISVDWLYYLFYRAKKNKYIMNISSDPHFNMFYSYAGGHNKDLEHLNQLEDNITRAFIITLSGLDHDQQLKFLIKILGTRIISSRTREISYDLQNLKSKLTRKYIHGLRKKILLTISGGPKKDSQISKSCFGSNNFKVFDRILQKAQIEDGAEDLKKKISKKYRENQKSGLMKPLQFSSGIEISHERLNSIYRALHDSRPDAWIYSQNFAILIETKTGKNGHDEFQLYRHLTNKNGFNIGRGKVSDGNKCNDYELVNMTWTEIGNLLFKIAGGNICVDEFRRYLVLSGQVLDLSFIVESNGYSHETMRAQFPLLLADLDKKIYGLEIEGLTRGNRPLFELWDYYGFETNKGKIGYSPNYLIEFDQDWACFFLRTNNRRQMRILLESSSFREILLEIVNNEEKLSERYFIGLRTDRIIDWKKGAVKGEKFDTLSFSISLCEMEKRTSKKKNVGKVIDELLKSILELTVFSKRLSFGFKILYPDVTRIDETNFLRKENAALFRNSSEFIDFCASFVKDSKHLLGLMRSSDKKGKRGLPE